METKEKIAGMLIVYPDESLGVLLFDNGGTWQQVDEKCNGKKAKLLVEEKTIHFYLPCDENVIAFPKELNPTKELILEPYACNPCKALPGVYYLSEEQSDSP